MSRALPSCTHKLIIECRGVSGREGIYEVLVGRELVDNPAGWNRADRKDVRFAASEGDQKRLGATSSQQRMTRTGVLRRDKEGGGLRGGFEVLVEYY